jgi:hypothetical protein
MSAGNDRGILRQRVRQALANHLAEHKHVAIAGYVDCDATTIGRRPTSLARWPSEDLFAIAEHDREVADAIVDLMQGTEIAPGEPTRAVPDLFQVLTKCGATVQLAAEIVADGQVDKGEARRALLALRDARRLFDQAEKNLRPIAFREVGP